ncbi:hypothetical protein Barb4_00301 [Bacteroidales bacterium Barb4]|nr:hypothetical protein Barb4_00301 [Bacteroidales bacterium Barb4]
MLRSRPEGTEDFSPTCSATECGVTDKAVKKVLKERPNIMYPCLKSNVNFLYRSLKKSRIIPNRSISFACTGLRFIMRLPFFLNLLFLILRYYFFFTRGKSKITGFGTLLEININHLLTAPPIKAPVYLPRESDHPQKE